MPWHPLFFVAKFFLWRTRSRHRTLTQPDRAILVARPVVPQTLTAGLTDKRPMSETGTGRCRDETLMR
jgi:hypothetical protein